MIVCAKNQNDVLERHDKHERPKDGRNSPNQMNRVQWNTRMRGKDFLDGIQWAGANIPINDTDRSQREGCHALFTCDMRIRTRHGGSFAVLHSIPVTEDSCHDA